jgi:lactam utilization protein B
MVTIDIYFDSLCVHGDTAEAVLIAAAVRDALAAADVSLRSFVG